MSEFRNRTFPRKKVMVMQMSGNFNVHVSQTTAGRGSSPVLRVWVSEGAKENKNIEILKLANLQLC